MSRSMCLLGVGHKDSQKSRGLAPQGYLGPPTPSNSWHLVEFGHSIIHPVDS